MYDIRCAPPARRSGKRLDFSSVPVHRIKAPVKTKTPISAGGPVRRLRALLARVHRLQDDEKCRLARDIHDDICQKLTALSIELSLLRRRLGDGHDEAAKVEDVLALAGQISRSVRQTMRALCPDTLAELGLVPAVGQECRRRSQISGRPIVFHAEADEAPPLEKERSREAFRLVQEALRHFTPEDGAGGEIRVRAGSKGKCFRVDIHAAGATPETVTRGERALGWLDIRERTRHLGGKVSISPSRDV